MESLFLAACGFGDNLLVSQLCMRGQDVQDYAQGLHQAAYMGYGRIVQLILATGRVNVDAVIHGETTLLVASTEGNVDMVDLLLENGGKYSLSGPI